MQKSMENAAAKSDVLKQALVQRDFMIERLSEQLEDARVQMEEVKSRANQVREARDSMTIELQGVMAKHAEERKLAAATLFEGLSQDELRIMLPPDIFQRWCSSSAGTPGSASSPASAYGMPGVPGYPYQGTYNAGGYGYPFGY